MDLVTLALRRKLARAEDGGDTALAERIRSRLKPPVVEAKAEPPVVEEVPEELEAAVAEAGPAAAIAFASPQAEARASEYGLGPDDFDFGPSGQSGYTVADVERASGQEEAE